MAEVISFRGLCLLSALVLISSGPGLAVTVGHTGADRAPKMSQATMDAIGRQKWFFTHASVGGNIVTGMNVLHTNNPARYQLQVYLYDGNDGDSSYHGGIGTLGSSGGYDFRAAPPPASLSNGVIYECMRGNPDWSNKILCFSNSLSVSGWATSGVDFVMDKFCWIDPNADPTNYCASLSFIERTSQCRSVRVVYATMPLTTETAGSDNDRRNAFNRYVRTYCLASNKCLYDIADVQAWTTGGVEQTYVSGSVTNQRMYSGYAVNAGGGDYHLNAAGRERAALAWYALAASGLGTFNMQVSAPATNGIVRPLWGINAGPYPNGTNGAVSVSNQYRDVGITMVRAHDYYGPVDMAEMYPDQSRDPNSLSSFNFTNSDAVLASVAANGHEIFFRLGNSWNNSVAPTNSTNWVAAATNVLLHYTQGKWGGYNYPIRYVEVWNEPDNTQFWDKSQAAFLPFYSQVARAVKTNFPSLKVGGPGFVGSAYYIPTTYPAQFVSYCRTSSVPLDFLSWHIYGDDPDDYRRAGLYYRSLLDTNGFTNAANVISEWNVNDGPRRVDANGAALMTGAWIGLQDGKVDLSHFYRGQDPNTNMAAGYGIFNSDGSYKKAAYMFKAWSYLQSCSNRLQVQSSAADGVSIIAGADATTSSVAILLSSYLYTNIAPGVTNYSLAFPMPEAAGTTQTLCRYQITTNRNLELVERMCGVLTGSVQRALSPNTVELITVSRAAGFDVWSSAFFITNSAQSGATNDPDGDGFSNWDEYVADTAPTSSVSGLPSTLISGVGSNWYIQFSASSTARVYDVLWNTNLVNTNWAHFNMRYSGSGTNLVLSVTSSAPQVYFKGAVRVP